MTMVARLRRLNDDGDDDGSADDNGGDDDSSTDDDGVDDDSSTDDNTRKVSSVRGMQAMLFVIHGVIQDYFIACHHYRCITWMESISCTPENFNYPIESLGFEV